MGYVREMKVNAGDRVSAGQLIAVLDARDLEAGVQQASAGVVEAQSAIPEADNGIAAAKANLELTQVTYKRMKDLYDQRSISNQEFDEMTSRLKLAQANYETALARRKQLDAKIKQAESVRNSAEITRGWAEIRAPFAGVVTEKRASAGDMAAPGTPLLTIEQAGAYQLEVPVEEAQPRCDSRRPGRIGEAGRLRSGDPGQSVGDHAGHRPGFAQLHRQDFLASRPAVAFGIVRAHPVRARDARGDRGSARRGRRDRTGA